MSGPTMLLLIAAIFGVLYLLDRKTNGIVGRAVDIFLVVFLLLAVFVCGGGHLDGSGTWSLNQLINFVWK